MIRPKLVVMVKEPHPGRVKTRLGRDIGLVGSAWWFRHQVRALLRRIEDPRWDLILAVAPDREGMQSRVWPAHFPRLPQGQGDLGDRMGRIMRSLPPGPVCIIGADIPGVGKPQIARAFAALAGKDAAFGPAPDGGFWLSGCHGCRAFQRSCSRTCGGLPITLWRIPCKRLIRLVWRWWTCCAMWIQLPILSLISRMTPTFSRDSPEP